MERYNTATGTVEDYVTVTGESLAEPMTEADAVAGKLTFSEKIRFIEIFNTDTVNMGIFNVNGINIPVPPNTSFKSGVSGTPLNTVTVSGATTYIVNRYV